MFSALGGRSLSFEDVPPELMAGVDVYKNPSAGQIEGAIGGLVNLRTAMPFDYKGMKASFSAEIAYSSLRHKASPSYSGPISNRWDTGIGQFGALIDLSRSVVNSRGDGLSISPYYPRTNAVVGNSSGAMRWISPGASWSTNDFERTCEGAYGALQWKQGDFSSGLTVFKSKCKLNTTENAFFQGADPSTLTLDPGATFDAQGALLAGLRLVAERYEFVRDFIVLHYKVTNRTDSEFWRYCANMPKVSTRKQRLGICPRDPVQRRRARKLIYRAACRTDYLDRRPGKITQRQRAHLRLHRGVRGAAGVTDVPLTFELTQIARLFC